MPRLLALALLLATTAACGDDGSSTSDDSAGRRIAINATDALRFEPASITAKAGEKISFVITNTGTVDHEFVIGDADYQASHEDDHGGHAEEDGGAAVDVPAGKTATLSYTMPASAPTYACHLNSHDDAGMTGTVTYG